MDNIVLSGFLLALGAWTLIWSHLYFLSLTCIYTQYNPPGRLIQILPCRRCDKLKINSLHGFDGLLYLVIRTCSKAAYNITFLKTRKLTAQIKFKKEWKTNSTVKSKELRLQFCNFCMDNVHLTYHNVNGLSWTYMYW